MTIPLSNAICSLLCGIGLTTSAQAQPAYIELTSPDVRANGRFGRSCGGLPDLTGDRVGEFYVRQGSPSVVHVYNGSSLELLYSVHPALCGFGFASTDSAGDLNGDGIPEVMIALECGDGIGQVMVANGKTGASLFMLNSPNPTSFGYFGMTVRLLPDMNGDGKEDWLIHQQEYQSSVGRVYIFDSQTREVVRTIQNRGAGFTFHMERVGVIPDVDGDGKPELLLSDFDAPVVRDGQTIANAGRVLVRSLKTGEVLYEILDPDPSGGFGFQLVGIGDITADKVGDIAIGSGGDVQLFSGSDGRWLRTLPSGRMESLPDLNEDGVPELLIQERASGLMHLYNGATSVLLKTIEYPGPVDGTPWAFGTVRQTAPPGLRAFLFNSASGGESNEGRAYYMPFTPFEKPPQLKALGAGVTGFRMQVIGEPGSNVEVQSTSDFKIWEPITSLTMGAQAADVDDSAAADRPHHFYRAVQK